ncbi:MAG: MFS transporter [Deltaproteobacteria bacterium]|nr:MFS transporter [Deltaproteobacteria bacterium]
MNRLRRSLIMLILCLTGGTIFGLPYTFEVFYIPMQQAMGLSKTQMGVLMGLFAGVSMAAYFPGGWLADRFSPRKLIALGMTSTGLGGFYFATFPDYGSLLWLHAYWGVSINLVFWSAMIKATRDWAPSAEQGRAFGTLEAGRGVFEVLPAMAMLAVFAWLGSTDAALATVLVGFSVVNITLGLAAWWVLEDRSDIGECDSMPRMSGNGWARVVTVLKMPTVWLTAIIIMATNTAYWATYYFTPYASEVFLLSVAIAGLLSIGRMWVKPFAALASGFVADRFGISRTVAFFMVVTTISFGLFAITPSNEALLPLVVVNLAVAAAGIFSLRGIYWALLDEGSVPASLTGTAAGAASVIGFLPEIYMPLIGGVILDGNPGASGYRLLFTGVTAAMTVGVGAAFVLLRRKRDPGERYAPESPILVSAAEQSSSGS